MSERGGNATVRQTVTELIERRIGEKKQDFLLPPPVYETIGAEVLDVNEEEGWLSLRFPMLRRYLNPYGTMQGGMIAAAIDNTIGPLSMMVAPPNVTRTLELEYIKPASGDLEYIDVRASVAEQAKRRVVFSAEVFNPQGELLVRAEAVHLVVAGLKGV